MVTVAPMEWLLCILSPFPFCTWSEISRNPKQNEILDAGCQIYILQGGNEHPGMKKTETCTGTEGVMPLVMSFDRGKISTMSEVIIFIKPQDFSGVGLFKESWEENSFGFVPMLTKSPTVCSRKTHTGRASGIRAKT